MSKPESTATAIGSMPFPNTAKGVEVSLEKIKNASMSPQIAPGGSFTDAQDYRSNFPDGRIGSDPSLATVADGEKLVALSKAGLIADFAKFAKS